MSRGKCLGISKLKEMYKFLTGVLSGRVVGSTVGLRNLSYEGKDNDKSVVQSTNQAISESRKSIEQLMLEQGVPGDQVAVSRNGRLIWSEGIGLADVENSVAQRKFPAIIRY